MSQPVAPETMRWSYSRLANTFEKCRLQFWWKYVVKDYNDVKGEALIRGLETHKHFENRLRDGTPLPWDWKKWERLCVAIDQYPVRMVEHPIHVNGELQSTAEGGWMTMNLDVMVLDGGENARVIDWKTGKLRVTDQLRLYALGVMSQWPQVNRVMTTFVWLDKDPYDDDCYSSNILTRERHFKPEWEKWRERVSLYTIARERNDWTPNPGWHCRWCHVRPEQCPHKAMES